MSSIQPTYKRQRFLLAFMRQLNRGVSSTDLQKLVFLHTMENNTGFYEFIPYKFGAYSFQLAEDVDILCKDGYLSGKNKRVKPAGEYSQSRLFNIAVERGNNLIRKAYREYPYYTINSDMDDRKAPGTVATVEFLQQMRNQIQSARKSQKDINAADVASVVANMVGQAIPMDGESVELFKRLAERVFTKPIEPEV